MASTQISRIQVRRGLQENLPNLAAGEFGWAVDSRRLFIGNGPTTEGAPSEGVTEVLTELAINSIELTPANILPSSFTLTADQSTFATTSLTVENTKKNAAIEYTMTRDIGGTVELRTGRFKVGQLNNTYIYEDEFIETANLGITLGFANISVNDSALTYISANVGNTTTFTYTVISQF